MTLLPNIPPPHLRGLRLAGSGTASGAECDAMRKAMNSLMSVVMSVWFIAHQALNAAYTSFGTAICIRVCDRSGPTSAFLYFFAAMFKDFSTKSARRQECC